MFLALACGGGARLCLSGPTRTGCAQETCGGSSQNTPLQKHRRGVEAGGAVGGLRNAACACLWTAGFEKRRKKKRDLNKVRLWVCKSELPNSKKKNLHLPGELPDAVSSLTRIYLPGVKIKVQVIFQDGSGPSFSCVAPCLRHVTVFLPCIYYNSSRQEVPQRDGLIERKS